MDESTTDDVILEPLVRVPDVEDAVLGCLLVDSSLLAACDLDPDEFTSPDKRRIYEIMRRLGTDAQLATVAAVARHEVSIVSYSYLADLMECVPAASCFPIYVRQLRALRRAGSTCGGKPVILVPGQHRLGDGEVCVGVDHFASRVLAMLPVGLLYRSGPDVGLIVGEPGRRRFEPLTIDATRRVVDAHVTLFMGREDPESHRRPEPAPDKPTAATVADRLRFVPCSKDLGGLVADAAKTHPAVRELVTLTQFPLYRRDWTLSPPGYDAGIFYDEPAELVGIAPQPGIEPLNELFVDFPFRDEASRMNAIGFLLTPVIRHAVGNVPFHLVHSSMERTGKTKLVEAVALVVTGFMPPAMQISEREEETEKRITAAMRAGRPLLFFDNLRDFVDSPSFAALATASVWEGRILGSSVLGHWQNRASVVLTGNNVKATGELVKRTVPILLQPTSGAPEDRADFVHPDLPGWVRENRRRIWSAVLGLVEAWKAAGRPAGAPRFGGFEEWAAAVGGLLEGSQWFGNASEWRRAADPHSEDLVLLVKAWSAEHGAALLQAQTVAELAHRLGLFPACFAKPGHAAAISFSRRVLHVAVDRPVEHWRIRRVGSGSSSYWRLEAI